MTIENIIIVYLLVSLIISIGISVCFVSADREDLFLAILFPLVWVVWLPVITLMAASNLITKAIISQIEAIKAKSKTNN